MRSKTLLVAVGAFGYGLFVGWAFTADHFEKKIKDKTENDVLRSKINNNEKAVPAVDDDDPDKIWEMDESFPYTPEQVKEYPGIDYRHPYEKDPKEEEAAVVTFASERDGSGEPDVVDEVATARAKANLKNIIEKYTSESTSVEQTVLHADGQSMPYDNTPPFVISRDIFAYDEDEGDNYDKLTVTYYPEHRILLDDGDELVDDVDMTIGWRSLAQFGGESGDPDVVFVRNRRMMTDFEVIREEEPLPLHIKYGMGKEEFQVNKAAGTLRLRDEDL
jgi:hypothetical protein